MMMRHSYLRLFLPMVTFTALLACGGPSEAPVPTTNDPQLLARHDQGEIRVADLDAFLLTLPPAQRKPAQEGDFPAWIRDRVDGFFLKEVLSTPEALETARSDPAYESAWEPRLQAALARRYLADLGLEVEASLEEIEAYYDANRANMQVPEQRVLRNLLLSFPNEADAATKEEICARAQELRIQILGGASFEELATRHSDSSTATTGGVVGLVTRDQLRGELAETVFSLEPGIVSSVVRTAAGCQLFLVQQVQPAYQAQIETVRARIAEAIQERKSGEILARKVREEIETLGLEVPSWPPPAPFDPADRDRVLFELDGETVTVGNVLARANRQLPPAAALMQRVSELVFGKALERDNPETAAAVASEAETAFAAQFLARKKLKEKVDAVSEEELRAFFEKNRDQFQSDPKVELSVYSWPIERGDPLRSMQRPRAFAERARSSDDLDAVWQDFAGDRNVRQDSIPLTDLRALLARNPGVTRQLFGDFSEGDILGPFRTGNRIEVLRVETLIPGRPLSFLEALEAVRTRYAAANASSLEQAWREELRQENDLVVFEDNLANFGNQLIDSLRGSAGSASTSTSTSTPTSAQEQDQPSDAP